VIISRTPLRISFVGGGTDLPAFYEREYGAVVSTAIDKYIYITVNRKFDQKIRASYSVTEIVDHVDDLRHQLIREALKLAGPTSGIEITSMSDIPSEGTGLGSSSTYTVGLLNALYAFGGHYAGAERLAREACEIEIDICRKPIGKQDQWIAAFGGLQYLRFNPDESVHADPIVCDRRIRDALQERLLLLYTGMTRSADSILSEQRDHTERSAEQRATLGALVKLAEDFRNLLHNGCLDTVGEVLHEAWRRKRLLAGGISNGRIDDWYDRARRHGAAGGKILGAGGGGFLMLYAPPERHHEITLALPELRRTPVRLEPQGSKIIYVEEGNKP
jgi:D-glycero-alpha-D-manno-heptose-7-phosphate kinase